MKQHSKTPFLLPEQIDEEGILVGWSLEHEYTIPPIGFHYGSDRFTPSNGFLNPIVFEGEGHLLTIAPTGAGKGTGCIIPTLLRHQGPVIVIDPKGENLSVTARQREVLGQKVVVLDPMKVSGDDSDRLNPFDLVDRESVTLVDDVVMLMEMILPSDGARHDIFWRSRGRDFLIGMMLHLILDHEKSYHTLEALRNCISQTPDDLRKVAGRMLESDCAEIRAAGGTIMMPAAETFAGILSYAQNAISFARGELVQNATKDSTFSFDEITRGDPVSLFLVIPPDKLESHSALLKLWVGSLMAAISRRRAAPPQPTLFILDEAAQLGTLPQLRQAITLLRGYGLQTWSFWQDVSQLQRLYPADWQTMVNNCKVLQAFGAANMNAANEVSAMTGFPRPWDILDLEYNEMILLIGGDEAVIAQRPDYLRDPMFRGTYDDNPRHLTDVDIMPKLRKPQRVYKRKHHPERVSSFDPDNIELPLWSEFEYNALNEAIGVVHLKGKELSIAIRRGLSHGPDLEWPMRMLIDGDWKQMRNEQALISLKNVWPHVSPNFGYGVDAVVAVRELSLDFYENACLYEAQCVKDGNFVGHMVYVSSPLMSIQLFGTSAPIYQMNSMFGIELDTKEKAIQYLKFFTSAMHAEKGSFHIVESASDLVLYADSSGEVLEGEGSPKLTNDQAEHILPLEIAPNDSKAEVLWDIKGTINYGSRIIHVEMQIHENGLVTMNDDVTKADGLHVIRDIFDRGLRTQVKMPVDKESDES